MASEQIDVSPMSVGDLRVGDRVTFENPQLRIVEYLKHRMGPRWPWRYYVEQLFPAHTVLWFFKIPERWRPVFGHPSYRCYMRSDCEEYVKNNGLTYRIVAESCFEPRNPA